MVPHYQRWNAFDHAETYKQAALERAARGGGSPFKAHKITSTDVEHAEADPCAVIELKAARRFKKRQAAADAEWSRLQASIEDIGDFR